MSPECRRAYLRCRKSPMGPSEHRGFISGFSAAWRVRAEQDAKTIADLRAQLALMRAVAEQKFPEKA